MGLPYRTGYLLAYNYGVLWTDNLAKALRLSRLFGYDIYDIKLRNYIQTEDYYD